MFDNGSSERCANLQYHTPVIFRHHTFVIASVVVAWGTTAFTIIRISIRLVLQQ
jgi:hypothetical protein